jgi:hypothetical protein
MRRFRAGLLPRRVPDPLAQVGIRRGGRGPHLQRTRMERVLNLKRAHPDLGVVGILVPLLVALVRGDRTVPRIQAPRKRRTLDGPLRHVRVVAEFEADVEGDVVVRRASGEDVADHGVLQAFRPLVQIEEPVPRVEPVPLVDPDPLVVRHVVEPLDETPALKPRRERRGVHVDGGIQHGVRVRVPVRVRRRRRWTRACGRREGGIIGVSPLDVSGSVARR